MIAVEFFNIVITHLTIGLISFTFTLGFLHGLHRFHKKVKV